MSGPARAFDTWTDEEKEQALTDMIAIAARGGHQAEMCIKLGMKSEDTFYRWKREIPEFKAMCEQARLHGKVFYDNLLLRGGAGLMPGFNATAIMAVVNNKFPEDYSRSPNAERLQTNNTINILSIGKDELKEKVTQQLQFLQQLGVDFKQQESVIDVDCE